MLHRKDSFLLIVTTLLLGAGLLANRLEAAAPVQLPKPLENMTCLIGDYEGRTANQREKNYAAPTADSSFYRTYSDKKDGINIQVFVGYWNKQKRKKRIKPPRYVFEGWGYYWMKEKEMIIPTYGTITLNQFLNEGAGRQELVYYTYFVNEKIIGSEYLLRAMNLKNALISKRTNAAVVRISTFLEIGDTVESVEGQTEQFIKGFMPALMDHMSG